MLWERKTTTAAARGSAGTRSSPRPKRSMAYVSGAQRSPPELRSNHVETASPLSIKTGVCPEDCCYCSQNAHYDTGVKATRLMNRIDVTARAQRA